MAKRVSKKPQKTENQIVKSASGEQADKWEGRDKNTGQFVEGNNPKVGFHTHPENIDKTGASQKKRYNKKLLAEMLLLPLDEKTITEQFEGLKKLFPTHFENTPEKNWQFFMELQQLSLVFNKNPQVSQRAMQEIRDRLEGKAIQKVEQKIDTAESVHSFLGQFKNKTIEEPKNEE